MAGRRIAPSMAQQGEKMNTTQKESLVGLAKSINSAVPGVGGLLNEVLFDIRGRIAQKRINDFVESFITYLEASEISVTDGMLQSEDFNDLFISVIKRVTETKSEHRIALFREILKSHIITPYESDFRETFLDMVNRLDTMEISILNMFRDTGRNERGESDTRSVMSVHTLTSKSHKDLIMKQIEKNEPHLTYFEIEGKYEFYICDLISKSLLIDSKAVGNTHADLAKPGLTVLYISDFGKEFLMFIGSSGI